MGWTAKELENYAKRHWLEALGLTVAIIAFGYGCRPFVLLGIIPSDFAENLAAEILGIGLSISIIKILVDYYESKRWKYIQDLTSRALIQRIDDIISQVIGAEFRFLKHLNMDSPKTGTDAIKKFMSLIDTADPKDGDGLSLEDPELRTTFSGLIDIADNLIAHIYENVKWDLDEIQEKLIPRLLQTAIDQNIADMLISFEETIREFREINKQKKGGVIPFIQLDRIGQLQIVIKMMESASSIKNELNRSILRK
jgi:hypothetical protein